MQLQETPGAIPLDTNKFSVVRWDYSRPTTLTATEFGLLRYLMANAGRVLPPRAAPVTGAGPVDAVEAFEHAGRVLRGETGTVVGDLDRGDR